MEIDLTSGTTFRTESEASEMKQLAENGSFTDVGKAGRPPKGFKNIRCHTI
jgi:hypothetical protein